MSRFGTWIARGRLSLRPTPASSRGRPVRGLDLQLRRLPAADRKRVRHAGGLQERASGRDRRFSGFTRISDEADRKEHVFHLSPLRARRSSPPNRPSRISSLSQSGRSPTRRFRRRRSRATTLGATPGCTCRIRCGRSPRSCGGTRPRTTRTSTRFATNRPFALSSADISDRSSQPLRFPWIRPRDSGSRG